MRADSSSGELFPAQTLPLQMGNRGPVRHLPGSALWVLTFLHSRPLSCPCPTSRLCGKSPQPSCAPAKPGSGMKGLCVKWESGPCACTKRTQRGRCDGGRGVPACRPHGDRQDRGELGVSVDPCPLTEPRASGPPSLQHCLDLLPSSLCPASHPRELGTPHPRLLGDGCRESQLSWQRKTPPAAPCARPTEHTSPGPLLPRALHTLLGCSCPWPQALEGTGTWLLPRGRQGSGCWEGESRPPAVL